jgi:hypothetical protein
VFRYIQLLSGFKELRKVEIRLGGASFVIDVQFPGVRSICLPIRLLFSFHFIRSMFIIYLLIVCFCINN